MLENFVTNASLCVMIFIGLFVGKKMFYHS